MMRRARALTAAALGIAVIAVAGCGSDDFENEPKPAAPAQIGIRLSEDQVVVSPAEFGAGLVNFTIVNLGGTPGAVEIDGPETGASDVMPPGTTSRLKMELPSGEYEARPEGAEAEPFVFLVGPERESSSNELLLP
jgi:hypothetical protein